MSMCGVITTKDVLLYMPTIVRAFGPRIYLRCWLAIVHRRRTTFLSCIYRR